MPPRSGCQWPDVQSERRQSSTQKILTPEEREKKRKVHASDGSAPYPYHRGGSLGCQRISSCAQSSSFIPWSDHVKGQSTSPPLFIPLFDTVIESVVLAIHPDSSSILQQASPSPGITARPYALRASTTEELRRFAVHERFHQDELHDPSAYSVQSFADCNMNTIDTSPTSFRNPRNSEGLVEDRADITGSACALRRVLSDGKMLRSVALLDDPSGTLVNSDGVQPHSVCGSLTSQEDESLLSALKYAEHGDAIASQYHEGQAVLSTIDSKAGLLGSVHLSDWLELIEEATVVLIGPWLASRGFAVYPSV
ncbi:hypothetical protein NMY22_g12027 [Coprinellus aureogranulatus]|nr:hypothetical protein NMY22_g12027 [Coprinellus aureogranulatus]